MQNNIFCLHCVSIKVLYNIIENYYFKIQKKLFLRNCVQKYYTIYIKLLLWYEYQHKVIKVDF